jgi:hypothetical protein
MSNSIVIYDEPMNFPLRLPYNPTAKVIVLPLGAGIAWIGLQTLLDRLTIHSFSFWFGIVPIALGLLLAIRRFVFKRFLLLEREGLSLPSGFGRLRNAQIPYDTIQQVWQTPIFWMSVLRVGTKQGTFEVLSGMLPDRASYITVATFLNSRAETNKNPSHPES